jgi:hypothetical protein
MVVSFLKVVHDDKHYEQKLIIHTKLRTSLWKRHVTMGTGVWLIQSMGVSFLKVVECLMLSKERVLVREGRRYGRMCLSGKYRRLHLLERSTRS